MKLAVQQADWQPRATPDQFSLGALVEEQVLVQLAAHAFQRDAPDFWLCGDGFAAERAGFSSKVCLMFPIRA